MSDQSAVKTTSQSNQDGAVVGKEGVNTSTRSEERDSCAVRVEKSEKGGGINQVDVIEGS